MSGPVVARHCAVCKGSTTIALIKGEQPYVEIDTKGGLVRLWVCSPVCGWQAGVHAARAMSPTDPIELLALQQLFRGDGVEVVRR